VKIKKAYPAVSPINFLCYAQNITGLPLQASMMMMCMCVIFHLRCKNKGRFQTAKYFIGAVNIYSNPGFGSGCFGLRFAPGPAEAPALPLRIPLPVGYTQ